jgi:hypothetical protein
VAGTQFVQSAAFHWWAWPESKVAAKQMIKRKFLVGKYQEYHQVYQAIVSQFRFESASC